MEQHIHHSNLIENIDDPAEDAQSMIAWQYLMQQKELTHSVIQKVQKIITLHQPLLPHQRGYYRDLSKAHVQVGGKPCPHPFIVPHLMENWLLDYKSNISIENHIRFEKIHPFVDGNGRTGRMLCWWQDLQCGRQAWFFDVAKRKQYYKLFEPDKANKSYNFERSSDNTTDW
jgi:Fic family protein